MLATCPQGHEHQLNVPLDENVRWECPTCQSVSVVQATPLTVPDDIRIITDGDTGAADDAER